VAGGSFHRGVTAADSTAAARSPAALRDAQAVLAAAVQRLKEALRCDLALAVARDPSGQPALAAAAFEGPAPHPPAADTLSLAARLDAAADLATEQAKALRALVHPRRSGAAVAVRDADGEVLAVLVVAWQARSSARPRTLARLEASARRLAAPLAAAAALARLSAIDGELRRLDRLATLGTLAAEMAHEVRSPLVAVKTLLELLPERRDDPELMQGFLPVARAELARIERLLDLVVDHPRQSPAPPHASVEAAAQAATSLLEQLPRVRNLRLETQLEQGLPAVATSPDTLRQLILNLLLNAAEASPAGGVVRLTARRRQLEVEILVEDEGPGVPAEERERVFEAFRSTRGKGHGGIGLSICRRIASEAEGSIEVGRAASGGAAFRVVLPEA